MSDMAIMERHNSFKDEIMLALNIPDGSNPSRSEIPQTIVVIQLRCDVIVVDEAVI